MSLNVPVAKAADGWTGVFESANNFINTGKNEVSQNEVINQNDIIDKDWERKYIDKLNKKDALNIHEEERTIKGNEHNIKNIIKNYNDEQNETLSNLEIKSKYSKISTKAKYGW